MRGETTRLASVWRWRGWEKWMGGDGKTVERMGLPGSLEAVVVMGREVPRAMPMFLPERK